MKLSQKSSNYSFLILFTISMIGASIFGSCESGSNRTVKIEQGNNNDNNEIKVDMSEVENQTNVYNNYNGTPSTEDTEEEAGNIELLELIKFFVISGNESYNMEDWMIGTEENSPILWETEGLEWRDKDKNYNKERPYYGSAYRLGKVKIDLDGKPSHYILRKRKEQVTWNVFLEGARGGYFSVRIDNPVCSQQFDLFVDYFKSKELITEVKDCVVSHYLNSDINPAGEGMLVYSFEVNNRKVEFLEFYYCGGTCGCSSELVFNADGTLPIKESEVVLKKYK